MNLIIVQQDATVFSSLHFCRQLYMFRVLTPIIRSWYSCNYRKKERKKGRKNERKRERKKERLEITNKPTNKLNNSMVQAPF